MTSTQRKTNMAIYFPKDKEEERRIEISVNPFLILANIQNDLDENIRTCIPNELRTEVIMENDRDKYIYLEPDAFKTLPNYHKETFACEEILELGMFDFNINPKIDVHKKFVKKLQRHMNVLILKCSRYLERKDAKKIRFSVYIDRSTLGAYGGNFSITHICDPTTGYIFELKMIDSDGQIRIITKMSFFYNITL
jgi:hypothetical protein